MESCSEGGGGGRWRLRVLLLVLMWVTTHKHVLGCSSTNCDVVRTDAQGEITSPCYPQNYPNSQTCRWSLQAPAGFIVQLSFLDFDLEEAPGCIYDRVVVNTGSADVKFCGLTANGLMLNSTGNVMELSFISDFSVQKRGFSVSFRHVAVALRNQKVKITSSGGGQVTEVADSVSIPALSHMTVCFEVQRISLKQSEEIFTYSDSSNNVALSLGSDQNEMKLMVDGIVCPMDKILSPSNITSSMKSFCVLWMSSSGRVEVYLDRQLKGQTCSESAGHFLPAAGNFQLGGQNSLNGNIYNVRLWDYAMSAQQLAALTCDTAGNIIDWDNGYWAIPSTLAQTDNTLSCSVSMANVTPLTSGCASPALGCPAAASTPASSTDSTNIIHHTNANAHVVSITPSSTTTTTTTTPPTSMPLTSPSSSSSSSSTSATSSSSLSSSSAQQTTSNSPPAPTNLRATNRAAHESLFYRVSLVARDGRSTLVQEDVQEAVALWLNQTFQNWTHAVYMENISVQTGDDPTSFLCRALLVHYYITNESVGEPAVLAQLSSRVRFIGSDLQVPVSSLHVQQIENCPEDNPLHYRWPESRPTITQYLPCFPNKDQTSSRTCVINRQNYTSYWSAPDFINCTDIETIEVSAENAAEVAVQLADITNDELSIEEVSKVVTKVNQLVSVAKINKTLAKTVITILSNVMTSSESALASTSEKALKTVDELVLKIEFDEPSINISSRNLALGILAVDANDFNGTSFSAFIPTNTSNPQVDFESQQASALAEVHLPSSLLTSDSLSGADRSTLSRINFMFFSSTNLFQKEQDGRSLNSYVVASSVGNVSIRELVEPVVIQIAHLSEQPSPNPVCMFWDFSMNGGAGGWNAEGCRVSEESSNNKTICLCNHLTHFGILMDVSGVSPHIDPKNNKILTFITYIGCGISAIFSAATLLTYVAFEKLRRDYPSKILMNLSTSLLFLNMVFLLDGWLASLETRWLCLSVAVLLHYFLLTSFTWMGLESIHMYIALVKVFNTYIRRYILKFCLVGWGLPALLVSIVVAVDKNSYGLQEYGKGGTTEGSSEFCWIKKPAVFYVTCVGYFCLVFLLNVAMFIVVMLQICGRNGKRSNRTIREEVLRNLRSVVSLTFLLGMTWGFALFAWGPVSLPFMYLFAIFNSLQGLFIFIFHCALKENVQKQWRRFFCCGRFRLSDNSDWSKTATNNTKKVSSDNLAKSLSSSSFGSTTNWTSKAKATLNPFTKRHSNTEKCFSNPTSPKCLSSSSSSSTEADPNSSSSSSSSSILPVSQMIDKVKGYCSTRSDNFYKNIILSDGFAHSTRF
ncbi:adhesion G-protein coupled receptor G6 isoform X8 [Gouania willdenowi]|uniref:adhesion G-protein coupled receptor G6 isoform X8 n=1 Tax=Gouania willdenowi TaxID=441366 RepID=UPI001056149F|nr:adhesion G-protein coupled receptor G6 isoform X8 [Gouania willdenowi]